MSWQKVRISSFLTERANRIKPAEANQMGLKRLQKIDFSGNIHLVDNKPTRTSMILVHNGDLVISGINVEKGALAVYEGGDNVLATIHYSSYEYDENKIDIEYLNWFLKSTYFKTILNEQVKGGIKTEIKPKHFLPLEVMLPDLPMQRTIAKKVNSVSLDVDDLHEITKINESYVQQLRQAILQEAVQGKLVEQDPNDEPASVLLEKIKAEKEQLIKEKKIKKEKPLQPIIEDDTPYDLPQGWRFCRIFDIAHKVTDGEHSTPERTTKGYYLLSARNVTNSGIQLDNVDFVGQEEFERIRKRCNPDKGDILISCSGSVGRVCVVDMDNHYVMVRSAALVKQFQQYIDPNYLMYCLRSPFLQEQMLNSSKATAQANLFLGKIKALIIPLPPLEEQKRIVAKVNELMKLCDGLEEQIKKSKEHSEMLMQSILHEAFNPEPSAQKQLAEV